MQKPIPKIRHDRFANIITSSALRYVKHQNLRLRRNLDVSWGKHAWLVNCYLFSFPLALLRQRHSAGQRAPFRKLSRKLDNIQACSRNSKLKRICCGFVKASIFCIFLNAQRTEILLNSRRQGNRKRKNDPSFWLWTSNIIRLSNRPQRCITYILESKRLISTHLLS